jgi:hypothetical protein
VSPGGSNGVAEGATDLVALFVAPLSLSDPATTSDAAVVPSACAKTGVMVNSIAIDKRIASTILVG